MNCEHLAMHANYLTSETHPHLVRPNSVQRIQRRPESSTDQLMRTPTGCACGGGCPRCAAETPSRMIHAKFEVSRPGDPYELEADRVAKQVMRMPDTPMQRQGDARADVSAHLTEEHLSIQRQASGNVASGAVAAGVTDRLGLGSPLDSATRDYFEPRLGYDFSGVRLHTDDSAAEAARAVQARAYTVGRDIVFGHGEYAPDTFEGKRLLAHELTHTIQQHGSPAAIQREALDNDLFMRDPIHGPILDTFSRETGVPRDRASQHSPEYEAWLLGRRDAQLSPSDILNNQPYTSSRYSSTVSAWGNDLPIWPALTTRAARVNFVRFILSFDETNCVPLAGETRPRPNCRATASAVASFSNACQGYASQLYARHTSEGRLPAADTASLESEAHVILGNVPAKFHIPIRMATVPGHAFNAVLIDANPADVNSWLFIEPQTDEVFFASDPRMTSVSDIYGARGIFTLSRLIGYSHSFQQTEERSFLSSSAGTFTSQILPSAQRVFLDNFLRDIFIADDASAFPYYTAGHTPPQTYDQLIASYASQPATNLAMAFTVLNGRSFRRAPGGATQIMTRDVYLQLLNKPGLDALIPR